MNPNFSDSTKDSDHTGIRKPARRTMLVAVVRWFTALVAIAVVVEPIVWRGRLSVNPPVPSLIQSLRYTPNTTRLQEIAQINLQDIPVPLGYDALSMADRLLAGQDFMHGFSGAPYALPFTPKARASDLMLQRDRIGNRRPPVVYTLPSPRLTYCVATVLAGYPMPACTSLTSC